MTSSKGSGSGSDKPQKGDSLTDVRKKIRDQIAIAEEAKRLDLQRRRIGLAGKGVDAYTDKHLADAAMSFKGYIKALEGMKGVPSGGLSPGHFDSKVEVAEMMLISGVYWDLVKLYDRTRSPDRYAEFKIYLSKYIQFSKGMRYQAVASETMRKYIQANRPKHMKDFKDAYKQIAVSKCFIATELVAETRIETTPTLRDFRDQVLVKTPLGRKFVAWYYRAGPKMSRALEHAPASFRKLVASAIDAIAWGIRMT